jgi:poly(hydroxyalkanoate) depolymerase family esterase
MVLGVTLALAGVLFASRGASGASLSGPITGWAKGVPSYISMYEYVPSKLATNPPLLVVSHYCGGSAAGVFGEAQSGGIVAAADQYGFILVFPQTTNNCWDVGSSKALTRDGGGDTQAVAQMVTYALAEHGANKDRVYAVGTSSGAMMTQALLAIYPDVFKAGAEFAGVPAGCWAVNYDASNQWSDACAKGQVSHTAEEWGALVRAMDPGYNGPRPRVELWHGLADSTIDPKNLTEAIKEWTNVLGLGTDPTQTTTVTLANHTWTRERWQDTCGFTVLDAWSEQMGPHGTDANLNAMYVIPFLGLDQTGATDPGQCTGGAPGSGGAANAGRGGASGAGGRGGANADVGGAPNGGANGGTAGARALDGGAPSSGGGAGHVAGFGASGGGAGSALGGAGAGGGHAGSDDAGGREPVGASGAGAGTGASAAGNSAGTTSSSVGGGSSVNGGASGETHGARAQSSGCACTTPRSGSAGWFALAGAVALLARRRRARSLTREHSFGSPKQEI